MSYLSYNPDRNRPWTEHAKFPKGAIKYHRELCESHAILGWQTSTLFIYKFSDDRSTITLIPEENWSDCQGDKGCTYPEPHGHGFACDKTCKECRGHYNDD